MPRKILFFIESLRSGGKERRFIELLHHLKSNTDFELLVILTSSEIHYQYFFDLNIPFKVLIRRNGLKKDPILFFQFYSECKKFKPDIIHTWGVMTTFYSIPVKLFLRYPLIASLIADSKKNFKTFSLSNFFFQSCCYFADIILGNSESGFRNYGVSGPKKRLIYNGVRFSRFYISVDRDEIRKGLNVQTNYMIIMVASASQNKDYDFFLDVAKSFISIRNDVTFVGVGDGPELERLKKRVIEENITNVILTGSRKNIETLVASADIGVLFPNTKIHAEGISNSIIEYMALGLPVITTDLEGGSPEIIKQGESGYILGNNIDSVTDKIIILLDNPQKCKSFGETGRDIIQNRFSIDRMGDEFINLYETTFNLS